MSRLGLTKSKVKQARDILISQNRYPSVDAVRIELGNTGSKSTIYKYLKELEEVIYAELSGDFPLGDSRQPIYKSLRPFDLVS
ncbi:DNA-binding protein [Acinetobacter baumannii]